MKLSEWTYVAPHRIRDGRLALPQLTSWDEYENLNMQRLARVFEFQSCVAFVGSGASACLGYPKWSNLLPPVSFAAPYLNLDSKVLYQSLCESVNANPATIEPTQAIQMAEVLLREKGSEPTPGTAKHSLSGRSRIVKEYLVNYFETGRHISSRPWQLAASLLDLQSSPFTALMELPIRRFVTTNYDDEIEKELEASLGKLWERTEKSFEQDDAQRLARFAISMASQNRNMVFHCHGTWTGEVKRLEESRSTPCMVLTDSDYACWYLARTREAVVFQNAIDIILQSNPLLFVGYSLADFDLLRILRRETLRWESNRLASHVFLLLRPDSEEKKQAWSEERKNAWRRAKQIKLGVNLLPVKDKNRNDLACELRERADECRALQYKWKWQPKVKDKVKGPLGIIQPIAGTGTGTDTIQHSNKGALRKIENALEMHSIVQLIGPAGSGKFATVCEFAIRYKSHYEILVFHSFNNDDIYSYLKRVLETLCARVLSPNSAGPRDKPSRFLPLWKLAHEKKRKKPIVLVINNIDLLLGVDSEREDQWKPRNRAAKFFFETLGRCLRISEIASKQELGNFRVLLTGRAFPTSLFNYRIRHDIRRLKWFEVRRTEDRSEQILKGDLARIKKIDLLRVKRGFKPGGSLAEQLEHLQWELQTNYAGLMVAIAFLNEEPTDKDPRIKSREDRIAGLLAALRSNSSEMGTRVVRHVIREVDAGGKRWFETLLGFLACFNTPVDEDVFEQAAMFCASDLSLEKTRDAITASRGRLLKLGLLYEIKQDKPRGLKFPRTDGESNYALPRLVKQYFREVLEHVLQHQELREYGLHGLLSRGPFNSPGSSEKPKLLFDHFAVGAFGAVCKCMNPPAGDPDQAEARATARALIRAVIDILRGNFACNSVPRWGKFRDYIDMLSITIDLLRNYAALTKSDWKPGESPTPTWRSSDPEPGVASAEEMLYLYNELGLAFLHIGSVQDALRVWSLAWDWQKAVSREDVYQGNMYASTLNSHLGTAYMQLGRMKVAIECFEKALVEARKTGDEDLSLRMEGMLARVAHFGGDITEARTVYRRVVDGLGALGNRRAQSYFMRHLAALETRFGNLDDASRLGRESQAIAARENAADLVAFSSELIARILRKEHKDREALEQYNIALSQAKELDISRLMIDIKLGIAEIQYRAGDIRSAQESAITALKQSNENLLVLRQAKSLLILGKTSAKLGEIKLGKSLLQQANRLAQESHFHLVAHDAEAELASLRAR